MGAGLPQRISWGVTSAVGGTSGQWQGVLSAESLALLDEMTAKYLADYIRWLFNGSF